VLDRAADPQREVQLGLDDLAGLPICWLYGIQPESTAARVAPDGPVQGRGELLHESEALRTPDSATAGHDDPGLLDQRRALPR
jgi:hypothetical protein